MPARPPRTLATAVLLLATPLAGCAVVPRAQLEQSRKFSQALQAEVVQRRDAETKLRAQNSDLVARAIADQRQIQGLEDLLERQDRAVAELHDDRDRLEADLERVLRLVREPTTTTTTLQDRLDQYARSHPGVIRETDGLACSIPQGRLFGPGESDLSPLGRAWLRDLAQSIGDSGDPSPHLLVGPQREAIQLASTDDPRDSLTARRAQAVQRFLAESIGQSTARVDLDSDEPGDTARRVITVRLARPGRQAAGVDDRHADPK